LIRQTLDLFQEEQYMNQTDFEIYNYSDAVAPKVFPRRHNFYEIYYLLSDQVDYIIGNQEYHMNQGDFLLLPPGLLHYPTNMHIRPGQNYTRLILWCNIAFFESFAQYDPSINHMWNVVLGNDSFHIHPTAGDSACLYDHFIRLIDEQNRKAFASKVMSYSMLMEIFVLINRILYETNRLGKHQPSENLFSNVISYIHTHLTEELSLSILARQFYVSKGYISRIFKDYMGIPVHQYILSLRLEGCRKIIQTGMPITEATELYGFHDYSSFYRAFKNAFGVSPKEYQATGKKT